MSGMSGLLEDTNGCTNQYMCALFIYLMTVLLCSYGIIWVLATNVPGYGNNVVDGINATEKTLFEGKNGYYKWISK